MSVLILDKRKAQSLSSDLRKSRDGFMRSRRAIFALYLGASASLGVISLFQMGIAKRLPEPKLPRFDSEVVNSSPEAYSIMAVPDAVLGLASYAGTLALVASGASDRAGRHPALPLAMTAKMAIDVFNAARLVINEWTTYRSVCSWCLVTAAATFAAAPLAFPESRTAWKNCQGRH